MALWDNSVQWIHLYFDIYKLFLQARTPNWYKIKVIQCILFDRQGVEKPQLDTKHVSETRLFDWIGLKQRRYSQPKATSLSGTMLTSLSLLLSLPPADSPTVKAASGRPGIYASVLTADMQTPVPPLQVCDGASWPRCDEHVKPCGAAGERSINPQVSGPLNPSCTSFSYIFLIKKLKA